MATTAKTDPKRAVGSDTPAERATAIRAEIPAWLDLASAERARAQLDDALDACIAACAAYDGRLTEETARLLRAVMVRRYPRHSYNLVGI